MSYFNFRCEQGLKLRKIPVIRQISAKQLLPTTTQILRISIPLRQTSMSNLLLTMLIIFNQLNSIPKRDQAQIMRLIILMYTMGIRPIGWLRPKIWRQSKRFQQQASYLKGKLLSRCKTNLSTSLPLSRLRKRQPLEIAEVSTWGGKQVSRSARITALHRLWLPNLSKSLMKRRLELKTRERMSPSWHHHLLPQQKDR